MTIIAPDRSTQRKATTFLGGAIPLPTSVTNVRTLIDENELATVTPMRAMVSNRGDGIAKLRSDIRLGWTPSALLVHATLYCEKLERIESIMTQGGRYERDQWGDDALELQIDVGHSKVEYSHLIITPAGQCVAYRGFSNRHVQGHHPQLNIQVQVDRERSCWVLHVRIPFAQLGRQPVAGESWGLNMMRVDSDEPQKFSQWVATFGDALRPEYFGQMIFVAHDHPGDEPTQHARELRDYQLFHAQNMRFIQAQIIAISPEDVLREIIIGPGNKVCPHWRLWAKHAATETRPVPVRWESVPGSSLQDHDLPVVMELAKQAVARVESWDINQPTAEVMNTITMESLADAFLASKQPLYAQLICKAILCHDAYYTLHLSKEQNVSSDHSGILSDFQVIQAAFLAYAYQTVAHAGLVPEPVHAAFMRRMLRAGRYAAWQISGGYLYGNHQVFESAGLAIIAALFPEFSESDSWADIASHMLHEHFTREVDADGGYAERCGYHNVALLFSVQALAVISSSNQQQRFAKFMQDSVLTQIDQMYQWNLSLLSPDGTFPAFGDYRYHSQLRTLVQAAVLRKMPQLLAPVRDLAPELKPRTLWNKSLPVLPRSSSLSHSQYSVMRNQWGSRAHQMVVEHGILGGEHSHCDTMGFIAYAFGRPILLDTGMAMSYGDRRHQSWFRKAQAHNIVTIDDIAPEKIARRTGWKAGEIGDMLVMQSESWQHARGLTHERTILFSLQGVWVIFDRIRKTDASKPLAKNATLHLHTPLSITLQPSGTMEAKPTDDQPGLIIAVCNGAGVMMQPQIQINPSALPVPQAAALRQHDAINLHGQKMVGQVQSMSWQQDFDAQQNADYTTVILPYEGQRPKVTWSQQDSGKMILRSDDDQILFFHRDPRNSSPFSWMNIPVSGNTALGHAKSGGDVVIEELS
jgi:hypothetical protein